MTTIVVGATGATGQTLVEQLLDRGQNVTAVVRSPDKLPKAVREHPNLTLIHGSILDLSILRSQGTSRIATQWPHAWDTI